ncbi:serine hydrolase domain-containing protein [Corynebacterium glaucum]|uniref:serine hydrolase domain-containing protein n=1 Tax=Corynebacterium glaucum TaxID=187491 RepID=UPI002658B1BE|nr:serine hydrolase domain-containing protein [Corynebacterium glaucum]
MQVPRTPALLTGLGAGAVIFVLLIALGPRPIDVAAERTGNERIASSFADHAEKGHHQLAGFIYDNGEVAFGGLGADEHTEFEIGSVTKTFNAELVRQFIDEGSLTLDTQVQDIIDVASAPIADVTLEELLNHTSGLAVMESLSFAEIMVANFRDGGNAYRRDTPQDILDAASTAELTNRGEMQYSNYGHALLGQLLATHADVPYEELLRTRIFEPAGMDNTYIALAHTNDGAPRGLDGSGRSAEPWDMDGWAPAGAIRSTPADMAKYVEWVTAHGLPEYGWADLTGEDDQNYTFHNGGTGGFRTMLVWDPESGQPSPTRAAFVVGNTVAGVEKLGIHVLEETR